MPGYAWQSDDLVDGQIGVNTEDGTVHLKKSDNTIKTIGGVQSHIDLTDRETVGSHPTEAITGLDGILDSKEPVISPKNTAFNKDYGSNNDTVCQGDDLRLSDSRDPNAHTHLEDDVTDLDKYSKAEVNNLLTTKEPIINPKNDAFNKSFGTVANTVTEGNDSRLSDARPPTAHTHVEVDITDLDKYTQTEVNVLLTGKKDDFVENDAFNKDFGAIAETVTQGNDSRLSDDRNPTPHNHIESDITNLDKYSQTEVNVLLDGKKDDFVNKTGFNKDFGAIADTVTEGNDSRLSNARPPTAHTHVEANITDLDKYTQSEVDAKDALKEDVISPKLTAFNKDYGSLVDTVTQGNDPRLSDSRDPTPHLHVEANITNLDKYTQAEVDSGLALKEDVITPKLTAFNKDYGSATGTTCQGNDSRLSDSRPPTTHTHTESQITDLDKYTQSEVDAKDALKEDAFNKKTGFNKDFGIVADTVAEGDHSHTATQTSYVDTHAIGATEVQTAIDNLVVISGSGIVSVSATITENAGDGTVWGDLNFTDFTGHQYAVGTALQIQPNFIVTFTYGSLLYRWTGNNDALVGLGGTTTAIEADLTPQGSSDHSALSNRNLPDQHTVGSVTGLQGDLDGKEPTIVKNTGFNKDFGAIADTVTEGNDVRLSDKREPLNHTHIESQITDLDKYTQVEVDTKDGLLRDDIDQNIIDIGTKEPIIAPKLTAFNRDFGVIAGTTCQGDDSRLSDSRPPTAHTHVEVDITDLDKYTQAEVDASLALKENTFTKNTAFNKDFGSLVNTTCQGNDVRLSDSRPPTAHTHVELDITDLDKYTQGEVDALVATKKDDFIENGAFNKNFGAIVDSVTQGNDPRLSDSRPPLEHTHPETDITDLDKYSQAEVNVLLNTKEDTINPKNTGFNKNLGNSANTVTEGNDPRLSDNRDPNPHIHVIGDVTNLQTELDSKVQDKGNWVQAHYDYNDQVSKNGYLVLCTNLAGTDDYPIPVNLGDPYYVYDDVTVESTGALKGQPIFTHVSGGTNAITTGILYTYPEDIQSLTLLVNVPDLTTNTNYKIHLIEDPFGTPRTETIYDPFLEVDTFTVVKKSNAITPEGTQLLITVEAYTTSTSIEHENQYKYLRPGTGTPNSGQCIRTSDASRIRIHTIDNLGVDISSQLSGAVSGDLFRVIDNNSPTSWEKVKFDDVGTLIGSYYEFPCHMDDKGNTPSNNSTCASTLIIHDAGNTLYNEDLNYFVGTTPELNGTVQGYLKIGNAPYTLNSNAYGIDIEIQQVNQSDDWLIRAGGASASTGDGESGIEIVDNLTTPDATKALSANMGVELDQIKVNYEELNHKRDKVAGFENRSNCWIDFDFVTGEFTIIPNPNIGGLTEYSFWSYDELFTKSSDSIIIPKLADYIIYYNELGELAYLVQGIDPNIDAEVINNGALLARITINVTDGIYNNVIDLRYDVSMSPTTRRTFINIDGTSYKSGLAIENLSLDGSGDLPEHAQFSVQDGEIFLADNRYNTASRSQQLTFPAEIPIFYLYNQDWKMKIGDAFPCIYGGSVGADYTGSLMPYNPIDWATGVGDLVEVTNNDFVCVHYFANTGLYNGVVGITGQETYTTASNARSGALDEINRLLVNNVIKTYYTPIATVIFQTGSGRSNTPKAEIKSVDANTQYIDLRTSKVVLGSPAENAVSSFPEETFSVYDLRNQKIKFDLSQTDPNLTNVVTWKVSDEDMDFNSVPEYYLQAPASTPLTQFQEVSLDVNGNVQGYPASGGEGTSEFATGTVIKSDLVYASQNAGVVAYFDNTSNTIKYVVGQQQGDGSILWGTPSPVSTSGNATEINGVQLSATRVCFCWVTSTGYLQAQILDVNIGGLNVSGGSIRNYETSATSTADLTYNGTHIVFGYYNGSLRNVYSDTDNGTSLNEPYSSRTFSTIGTPTKVNVTSEGQNILVQYMNTSNDAYWIEAKWDKPTFGTGRYDDFASARQMSTDCIQLGGVQSENYNVFGQGQKADGTWQSYYTNYTSGSGFGTTANFGTSLTGKIAKIVNSSSGLGYNLVINNSNQLEVWEGSQSNPSAGYTKVYTSMFTIGSTAHTELQVTMFESSWACILIGDTAINNDIWFVSSNITRTDNYIGNAVTAVNQGELVEVYLGLPVITHSGANYSAGDIFNLGPYKYQAISHRQVVIIIEEVSQR